MFDDRKGKVKNKKTFVRSAKKKIKTWWFAEKKREKENIL